HALGRSRTICTLMPLATRRWYSGKSLISARDGRRVRHSIAAPAAAVDITAALKTLGGPPVAGSRLSNTRRTRMQPVPVPHNPDETHVIRICDGLMIYIKRGPVDLSGALNRDADN